MTDQPQRWDIQIDVTNVDPAIVRKAMAAALDAISEQLKGSGPDESWEAVAFDSDGDAFDSAGEESS